MTLAWRKGASVDSKYVEFFIKTRSVNEFLHEFALQIHNDYDSVKAEFSSLNKGMQDAVVAMPNAVETLAQLDLAGVRNYVYTHKGATAFSILDKLGISKYFYDIITSLNGFKRKPDPEAIIYLLEKYHMNRLYTYYVGDRNIDVECAKNAGVKSILLHSEFADMHADYEVDDLYDIPKLFDKNFHPGGKSI